MPPPVFESDSTRGTIANIWRETAVLYLHTVISDAHPGKSQRGIPSMAPETDLQSFSGVPEIVKTTNNILDYKQMLGPSTFDRALIFPLVLAGTMTDDPMLRELVVQRFAWHRDDFYNGSMSQARTFVDYVHTRRQAARHSSQRANANVDWRECMRERWSAITLV